MCLHGKLVKVFVNRGINVAFRSQIVNGLADLGFMELSPKVLDTILHIGTLFGLLTLLLDKHQDPVTDTAVRVRVVQWRTPTTTKRRSTESNPLLLLLLWQI